MTNTVQQEVKNLQGMMTGGIAKAAVGLPERFVIEPGSKGNCLTIRETTTGRKLEVGLCDMHGALAVLKFFE